MHGDAGVLASNLVAAETMEILANTKGSEDSAVWEALAEEAAIEEVRVESTFQLPLAGRQ